MATNLQTVFDYLNVTQDIGTINQEHLKEIQSAYDRTNPNDSLKKLIETFQFVNDRENIEHLKLCVDKSSISLSRQSLFTAYLTKKTAENRNVRKNEKQESTTTNDSSTTESISEMICQIFLKKIHPFIDEFVDTFLLQTPNPTEVKKAKQSTKKPLPQLCILNIFIRHQLKARGETIDLGSPKAKFSLVDPINITDEFDTWYFDHLHGLFELNLIRENQDFPRRWNLTSDAQIFYRICSSKDLSNEESTIRNVDRPSTASLERFVEDVCEKQNNGLAKKWIDALHSDDILTYADLASLKATEWEKLKALSFNGQRTLRSYLDREKQMAANVKSSQQQTINSECELRANLHKIRLYFHYILVEQFSSMNIPIPAKLDPYCVYAAFDEMRADGFAEDGLFDQMKMFFLPLTMTEANLCIDERRWKSISGVYAKRKQELENEQRKLIKKLTEVEDQYYTHDDKIMKFKNEMKENRQKTTNRWPWQNKSTNEQFSNEDLLKTHQEEKDKLEPVRYHLRTRIENISNSIDNISSALKEPTEQDTRKINRDLIKPNRGFIMYGPPGTGKSEIMSSLSNRIGITMVAPPLAAGELNRSLVGESERIISDICMRCHQIPYLMCCISIDEIDSLTGKRNDKSSEGNVAKLSVFLSVIDGIKDVPNLMIFCATNRLHMMDEAFLRRMQGKFFVGRPSSLARKRILSRTKQWHVPPNLIEQLTIATTNFSGSALRALCRSITTFCADAERLNRYYQLDYRKMLELTDETARQYRVFIGAETLPELLLRLANKQLITTDDRPRFNILPDAQNIVYTGKILINFHLNRIDIEAIFEHPKTGEIKKLVQQEYLFKEETDLQQLIERLTFYGKSRNVQLLQLIDLNLLSLSSAHDEKEKFEVLKERLDECNAYRRSMIVYDLDSLVGINRSEGDSSTGRSTNLSLINHNIYTFIQNQFQSAYVEPPTFSSNDQNTSLTKEKWSIMTIRDEFLLRQFYDDTKFTRSQAEIDREKADEDRANQRIYCVQCNDYYLEDDNKMGVCMHHDGFVYDNQSSTLTKFIPSQAILMLLNEEADSANTRINLSQEEKERRERDKQRFKYICCNQTLQTSSAMQGCKKGKHSPSTMKIEDWNYICQNNQDYDNKRLAISQQRTQRSSVYNYVTNPFQRRN